MQATESLRRDHALIEKMLKALELTGRLVAEGKTIPAPIVDQTMDFVTNFTNVCHHGKEEHSLFPMLERSGMPKEGGPIARMIFEHQMTNELADKMVLSAKKYVDSGSPEPFVSDIRRYVEHVSLHLTKENMRLFMMADMILSPVSSQVNNEVDLNESKTLEKLGRSRQHFEQIVDKLQSSLGK